MRARASGFEKDRELEYDTVADCGGGIDREREYE